MGLDTVEIVMAFEQAFGIEISNKAAAVMMTPRDVRDFVMRAYVDQGRNADPDAIFKKIRKITADFTAVKPEKIGLDTRFVDDLGLD